MGYWTTRRRIFSSRKLDCQFILLVNLVVCRRRFFKRAAIKCGFRASQCLLNQVTSFIPKLVGAASLLGIAWVVATVVKTLVTRGLGALNLDRRMGKNVGDNSDFSFTETLANALYWFIFLLFLPSVLNALQLRGTLEPVQGLLDEILAMLPNILGAIIIGAVFWFVAQYRAPNRHQFIIGYRSRSYRS